MLKRLGYEAVISSDPEVFSKAILLILPGVGHFELGMQNLQEKNLIEPLNKLVLEKKVPILGICLGMQLMTNASEEGHIKGLGWLNAKTKAFPAIIDATKVLTPNIGWREVLPASNHTPDNIIQEKSRFYFVHSFFVEMNDAEVKVYSSYYHMPFCSAFQKDNIFGVQFHPEKSHKQGFKFFRALITGIKNAS